MRAVANRASAILRAAAINLQIAPPAVKRRNRNTRILRRIQAWRGKRAAHDAGGRHGDAALSDRAAASAGMLKRRVRNAARKE